MTNALANPFFVAVKAAVGALLAFTVVRLLDVQDSLSATFVAVVCVSPTVYSGVRRGLDQLAASAIGGVVVWALSLALPAPAVIAVGLFVTIFATFKLGFSRGYAVAAFTVLYMVVLKKGDSEHTFLTRIDSVAIGVASAFLVNSAFSLPLWRSVFQRRLDIVRLNVAAHYETLAKGLREPSDLLALFEDSFPLLRAVLEEASDAATDSRIRGGRTRARLLAAVSAAEELLEVAHHGKTLAFQLDRRGASAEAAAVVDALARAARAPEPLTTEPGVLEPAWAEPLRAAQEAWNRACAALVAFRSQSSSPRRRATADA